MSHLNLHLILISVTHFFTSGFQKLSATVLTFIYESISHIFSLVQYAT